MFSVKVALCDTNKMNERYESVDTKIMVDDMMVDPHVQVVFDQVRTLNALPELGQLSKEEIEEKVDTLNQQWAPLVGEEAYMSGLMNFCEPAPDDEDGYKYIKRSYPTIKIWLGEFLVDHERNIVDGVEITNYKIVLEVAQRPERMDEEEYDMEGCEGVVDVDEVQLSFEGLTSDQAIAYVTYLHNEVAREINDIFDDAGDDEEQATSALKEFKVTFDDDSGLSHETLETYINTFIEYDHYVPYTALLSGSGFLDNDTDSMVPLSGWCLVQPHHLILQELDNDEILWPCLKMTVYSTSINGDDDEVIMPLRGIDTFTSMRRYFNSIGSQSVENEE